MTTTVYLNGSTGQRYLWWQLPKPPDGLKYLYLAYATAQKSKLANEHVNRYFQLLQMEQYVAKSATLWEEMF